MNRVFSMLLLPCAASFASNLSISAIAGYGLPFPGQTVGSNSEYAASTGTTEYNTVYSSLADGLRVGGELGFSLNEFVTLSLGGRWESSSEIALSQNSTYTTYTTARSNKISLSGIALLPSVLFTLPGQVVRPYARFSGHFGLPTQVVKGEFSSTSPTATKKSEIKEGKYTGGIAWGFGGGLGMEYILSPSLSILGELNSESWTWAPEKYELTKHTINGVDTLRHESVYTKNTTYSDSYTATGPADTTAPAKATKQSVTYSALALNIGVKFKF